MGDFVFFTFFILNFFVEGLACSWVFVTMKHRSFQSFPSARSGISVAINGEKNNPI